EGIESYEEYDIVKSLGVDIIQGFLFGRPVSASEFYKFQLSK
ncbi:EAL domain-containing protein, partial [Clostridioides difficile]|nr:EAL domain-containing protein [Clostridioides difficile]